MAERVQAAVFDVGRVIVEWDLRYLFAKLIKDADELDWFCANVVTQEWHFEHDAGRLLDDMLPERIAQFPQYEALIRAYRARFLETIPGPVPGTLGLIEQLIAREVPLFAITNFGAEFWDQFYPTMPIFDAFEDIVVSGRENLAKPDPAIFELAAKRFQLPPQAMLFIDDNADNISAAANLGWQVHHFDGSEGLAQTLQKQQLI